MGWKSYRDIEAWKLARRNAVDVYRLTANWPSDERFGLISQIRDAAASVAANIAEGEGRKAPAQFVQFLGIAHGSLCEVETFLTLSVDLGYTSKDDARKLWATLSECGKCIQGLKRQQRALANRQ